MATAYTTLLGLALPVTGELNGTWGDVVNDSITELVEDAIAGSATASVTSADWTLTTTGSGAANQARSAILIPTGTPGVSRNIIVPSSSKAYIVDNQSNAAVVVKGSATTGVSIATNTAALVAWDGADFVLVAQDLANASGTLAVNKGGSGQTTYTDGQLLIGNSSGNTLAKATLTQGSGVTITNGAGTITIAATGLGGDVVGPASATDNAVARYDGTTGKLIQNSAVTIADDGATVIAANSTSDGLRITQVGTGNALVVEDSANPDSTPVVIDANGSLVVGATARTSQTALFEALSFSPANVITAARGVADVASARFSFLKTRSTTTFNGGTTVLNNDFLGEIRFFGDDGSTLVQAAVILAQVDGTPGTNDMPGRLVFSTTADGASSPTERMRIDSAGRIGLAESLTTSALYVRTLMTGSVNQQLVYARSQIANDVTGTVSYFQAQPRTNAASFTVTNVNCFNAESPNIGAGSSITNLYGFYSNIASGTGRWNFYAAGTAENYLAGNLKVGGTAARGTTAGTSHLSIFNGTAPAGTLTNGITLYSASGDFNFMDSSGNGYQVGFRNIPQNSQSDAYTLVLADSGKHIFHPSADTTARTFTIPANGSVAFPIGTAVTFINQNGAGVVTIAITTDTMRLAGAGTTGSRTLAANGVATAIKVTSTEWIISGVGLT